MKKGSSVIYRQSGAIPFIYKDGKLMLLLVSNRKGIKWIIPKGFIEQDMKASETAAKESFEEAGIKGVVLKPAIGEYREKKLSGECIVKVFMLKVEEILDSWPEQPYRKRIWIDAAEVSKYVKKKKLLNLFSELDSYIKNNNINL